MRKGNEGMKRPKLIIYMNETKNFFKLYKFKAQLLLKEWTQPLTKKIALVEDIHFLLPFTFSLLDLCM